MKSFARIHMANLINFGILPLTFVKDADYKKIDQGDKLELDTSNITNGITLKNVTKGKDIPVTHAMGERDLEVMQAGGTLGYAASKAAS